MILYDPGRGFAVWFIDIQMSSLRRGTKVPISISFLLFPLAHCPVSPCNSMQSSNSKHPNQSYGPERRTSRNRTRPKIIYKELCSQHLFCTPVVYHPRKAFGRFQFALILLIKHAFLRHSLCFPHLRLRDRSRYTCPITSQKQGCREEEQCSCEESIS